MTEEVDISEFIDPGDINPQLEQAIRSPFETDFGSGSSSDVRWKPENLQAEEVHVNLENKNVEFHYYTERDGKHTAVEWQDGATLIRYSWIPTLEDREKEFETESYYLVLDDTVLYNTGNGYEKPPEQFRQKPLEIASHTPELYHEALQRPVEEEDKRELLTPDDINGTSPYQPNRPTVPPPETDPLMED